MLGIAGWLFPSLRTLYLVKGVTFAGEAFAGLYLYRLMDWYRQREGYTPVTPLIGAILLLLSPSVLVNGADVGQCDIWWVAFLLAALYYIINDRPLPTLIYCGLALAFKPQSLFLSPLFLVLVIKGRVPWKLAWVPLAVYVATCIPAWLEGRSLYDLLMIYPSQAMEGDLNSNAPNIYLLSLQMSSVLKAQLGILVGLALALAFIFVTCLRWKLPFTLTQYTLLATLSAAMLPFVLPHMHDRYFFAADILSLLLACLNPRWCILTLLFQSASILAPPDYQTHLSIFHNHNTALRLGLGMNAAALAILFYLCIKHVWTNQHRCRSDIWIRVPLASSITLTLASWICVLLLWSFTPVTLANITTTHAGSGGIASVSFSYFPGQSGVLRIVPSADVRPSQWPGVPDIRKTACLKEITINGNPVSHGFSGCYGDAVTMDFSPYLHYGANQLQVTFSATGSNPDVAVYSMRSTPEMLAILYYLCFGLLMHRILRADRKALRNSVHPIQITLLAVGLAVAWWARSPLMDVTSNDYRAFIDRWLFVIRYYPGIHYAASGSNYTPFYIYMMGVFDRLFPTLAMLHAVKWLSFLGDVFAGFWLWRIIALCNHHPLLPPAAVTLLWLAPSVVLNSTAMAQCDSWWVGMLLAAMYYVGKQRPSMALFWGGMAFAFKLQAVFLAPLLLILVLEGIVPWKKLWILPAAYLLICLPAWMEGVPMSKLLLVYWRQFHTYGNITETGNIYVWLPLHYSYETMRDAGLIFSAAAAAGLVTWTHRRWPRQPTPIHYLLLAALFSTLMPFILPKMINRYFLAGDVLTLVIATLRPCWFLPALLMQCASILTFQSWQLDVAQRLTGLDDWSRFRIAAVLYAAAIALLLWLCQRYVWKLEPTGGNGTCRE
ncbi:MAG: hypothetical protein KGI29_00290 [Pseudomonadota bacterium]|nr:hypothetical protein [Pseudomonadota bacterium]